MRRKALPANRHGDFGRSRGETRDQSKAELPGTPLPRRPHHNYRLNSVSILSIAEEEDQTNTKGSTQVAFLLHARNGNLRFPSREPTLRQRTAPARETRASPS